MMAMMLLRDLNQRSALSDDEPPQPTISRPSDGKVPPCSTILASSGCNEIKF